MPRLAVPILILGLAAALSLLLPASLRAQTVPATSVVFSNEVEASLVRTLETLKEGSIRAALREIDLALEKNPNFRLGHLIKGDLLMAQSGAPVEFLSGKYAGSKPQPEMVASLRSEAKARLTRYFDGPPLGHLPSALLQLAPRQEHALLMDSEKSRLYIFRNVDGAPQLVTDFYISAGKNGVDKEREGDQRTPLGVYTINSAVAKERLGEFYGPGAFPLNFPNEWDKRLGKTGSGIWLHGTPPTTYSRPPRASDGCVVLTNEDFESIRKFVDPGVTPIVIAPSVAWQSPDQWLDARAAFNGVLESWQRDWESLDAESYLKHYSSNFNADGKSFSDWSTLKRRINAAKRFVKVDISNLSVFEYSLSPNALPMMIVTFDQDYKSSNNSSRMKKRQYWQREEGQWRIVYEAAAS